MNNPLVSIIVPVHNAEKYIEETVESVLTQTFEDWELILVQNGSTDKTCSILEAVAGRDARIRAFDLPAGAGAAGARNAGVEAAAGRFIAFLDADDLWKAEKLDHELAFLKKMDAGFVFTGYEFGDENASPTGKIVKVPERLDYGQALKNTTIFTSTVMFDTRKIPREKIHMPSIKSEDTALWWQILREGHTAYGLNENLVIYRRPPKSLSSNKMEALRRIWYLYREWEGLNIFKSAWYFLQWAFRAVKRRV